MSKIDRQKSPEELLEEARAALLKLSTWNIQRAKSLIKRFGQDPENEHSGAAARVRISNIDFETAQQIEDLVKKYKRDLARADNASLKNFSDEVVDKYLRNK